PKKAGGPDDEPPEPDINAIDIEVLMGRARSRTEQKFRIGLRQGENEIVVKVILAAGGPSGGRPQVVGGMAVPSMGGPGGVGSFTFNFTPEGDDVINHEIATVLRQEALARASVKLPIAPPPRIVEKPAAAQPLPGAPGSDDRDAPFEAVAITVVDAK